MAKKTAAARKAAGGKGIKPLTPKQLHSRVASLLRGKALTGKAAAAFALAAPAAVDAAKKTVSFTCTNIGCLVAITSGTIHFVFSGTGGANFPIGDNDIIYAVKGPPNVAFAITVQGGTLDQPINSHLTSTGKAGGPRTLTV